MKKIILLKGGNNKFCPVINKLIVDRSNNRIIDTNTGKNNRTLSNGLKELMIRYNKSLFLR
jgi:hypothetical protein